MVLSIYRITFYFISVLLNIFINQNNFNVLIIDNNFKIYFNKINLLLE